MTEQWAGMKHLSSPSSIQPVKDNVRISRGRQKKGYSAMAIAFACFFVGLQCLCFEAWEHLRFSSCRTIKTF
jgi:tRNA threonylcarbamoyladenosine modification (KEOPS) complex Cgi121 subunit